MIDKFKRIEKLARDWLDLSYEINGWETNTYAIKDFAVLCYFAANSDHKTVQFSTGTSKFGIGFHNPTQFDNITIQSLKQIDVLIEKAHTFLVDKTAYTRNLQEQEIEEKRKLKILELEKQLASLKEQPND